MVCKVSININYLLVLKYVRWLGYLFNVYKNDALQKMINGLF